MTKSIIQDQKCCYYCGTTVNLERHHVLGGVANRKLSERYGLWIWCCHFDHLSVDGVQYDKQKNWDLKAQAQMAFEAIYGHDFWMKTFYKNYIY